MDGYNVPFHTRQEALRQPLSETEMAALTGICWMGRLLWMAAVLAPLLAAGYGFSKIQLPEWQVSLEEAVRVDKQHARYLADRIRYERLAAEAELHPCADRDTQIICGLIHPGITLECAQFNTLPPPAGGKTQRHAFEFKGRCQDGRLETVKAYMQDLEKALSAQPSYCGRLKLVLQGANGSPTRAENGAALEFIIKGETGS
ncbi:MAG: hypothetical protein PHV34_18200 [Verrucomicrobiae bacterium]|nr:hypothetical protein [Verrucomicrobiae bacterium]